MLLGYDAGTTEVDASNMRPSVIRSLIPVLIRHQFENPPAFRHLQLIIYGCQGVEQVFLLLVGKGFLDLDSFLIVFSEVDRAVVLVCETAGCVRDGGRSGEDMWVEGVRVHADVLEHVFVEQDTSAEDEALTEHPAQRDACKIVTSTIANGPTANIAMSTSEPDLLGVSRLIGVRDLPLEVTKVSFLTLGTVCAALSRFEYRLVARHRPFLNPLFVVFFRRSIPQVHLESRPALIKGDGVPEILDVAVGCGEGESARDDSYRSNSVPNAYEFDVDVDREGLLERVTLLPALLIFSGIHFVSEWDLLVIEWRQKSNLVDHACERSSGISPARETENKDLVPGLVCAVMRYSFKPKYEVG